VDNGLVQVILSRPEGDVLGIKYNGINNLLEDHNERDDRGYVYIASNHSLIAFKLIIFCLDIYLNLAFRFSHIYIYIYYLLYILSLAKSNTSSYWDVVWNQPDGREGIVER
jgi:hypothetical protein